MRSAQTRNANYRIAFSTGMGYNREHRALFDGVTLQK